MRFGKTLRQSIYAPWKDKYIDYTKLKSLLREDKYDDEDVAWTEEDENRFCDEIFNTQLEKVAEFQEETFHGLKDRIDAAFEKLKDLAPPANEDGSEDTKKPDAATAQKLRDIEAELDKVTTDISELKKYSNINYTGFLKIVKKHDRKRGDRYKVRPMMQLSLSQRSFNSEQGYSPLLNKLSIMYYAIRQQLDENSAEQQPLDLESQGETHNGERYTAHKFWVHPDNLLEVKTYIMRRLPALVYSEQSAKELDGTNDPTITSLYFDSPKFDLYGKKVERKSEASSLRVRWYGQLSGKPDLFIEQKIVAEQGSSEERKFAIKDKYVKPFIDGTYKMEKTVQKMERQGQQPEEVENFKKTVGLLQGFVQDKKLQPVLRANYVRTAFQKPADDRVRISIDTEVAFIREDTLDRDRPCRDPSEWHRSDIDGANLTYPFKGINQSEVSRFPYAILEIKLKEDSNRKRPAWIVDLMGSHLVHPAPRFSKFVHGVASLFEDYVNNLPFWLSDLEADIRKDPQKAFEAEEQRRAQRAEDEQAVGSFLGNKVSSYKVSKSSPAGKSYLADRMAAEASARSRQAANNGQQQQQRQQQQGGTQQNGNGEGASSGQPRTYGTLSSVLPGFSLSKYSKAKRAQKNQQQLPEGVVEPTEWIKNSGELKIEPKVWLANERTFLKWQHICILLGALSVSLYTAAGQNTLAEVMGIIYILIAVFAGLWGYSMMHTRRQMIMNRSGKDFDNLVGPLIISIALMVALVLNFVFAYRDAMEKINAAKMAGGVNVTDESARLELV
ncbi:Vacuolar transporter chaperone 3 [Colletotrichum orbiculare MAFF 240422]|uniref:Vacuolar transporter chaperone 3 n=1 Tax=Colletotrichum orbiculare (strain 104-T / ATCC 96160 / CBS 514.97 / LARS 414 / MAFF 240422) TaxID=1213857 RepID=N4V8A1_COLOR|nr:Vacuolar transporter chaperone 3 [Colletotrichum orbiculare MAFF 240422]